MTDIVPEDTPVEVVEHRLEGDDLICPECGETMVEIGKEVRRTLVIRKPEILIHEDWYYTYACPKCKQENTEVPIAEVPKDKPLISGSFASPEAVAFLMTQKYVMGSPIYRMERDFIRQGLWLSQQTMSNWMLRCAKDYPYRYLTWVFTEAPQLSQPDPGWASKLLPWNAPENCRPAK